MVLSSPYFTCHLENFFVMLLLSSQDFTAHQDFLFDMWEISFTLVFTSLFFSLLIYRSILRSCHRQFVFRFPSSQATCRSPRCYRNNEKGNVTSQKQNLCFCGTWLFSPKKLRAEKIPRQILFISIKAFKRYVARFLNRCSVHKWKIFSLTIRDSSHRNRKAIITDVLSFLSVEKKKSPFSLTFVYGPQSSHRYQW